MELRERRRRRPSVLNLTPLIDVLLLLLVFFMATTTFLESPAVEFRLPRVGGAESVRISAVVIAVDAQGRIYCAGSRLSLDELRKKLEKLREGLPDATLVVKADRDTRYERVVQVMTTAARCGFRNIQSPVATTDFEAE